MDTTGAHINKNGVSTKPGEFSKEELSAILKFGAQNMCVLEHDLLLTNSYKTDDQAQNQKLDEMDLDDILTKAEAHDTEVTAEAAGASLGGEGFLAQFAAIQDVKNDLSWDDIIPIDERVKVDEESSRALQDEEQAAANRKRQAARAPGAYEGMEDDPNEPKASSPPEKKSKATGPPRKTTQQRALELKGRLIVTINANVRS